MHAPGEVVRLGGGAPGKQPAEFLHTYWDVAGTGAGRVVLAHWDDFFLGLDRPLRPVPYLFDDLGATMSRPLPLARRDGVDVVLPVARQPSTPSTASCELVRPTPVTGAARRSQGSVARDERRPDAVAGGAGPRLGTPDGPRRQTRTSRRMTFPVALRGRLSEVTRHRDGTL
ncbi:hypothetical protein ACF061_34580 [Streptomyces sp. NPDC015220]|uniref:hypothetical protein n=1 Tax=Streptomyces sp. NPDC015220 TaxID=3364947 RepID=UPI0036FCA573